MKDVGLLADGDGAEPASPAAIDGNFPPWK